MKKNHRANMQCDVMCWFVLQCVGGVWMVQKASNHGCASSTYLPHIICVIK